MKVLVATKETQGQRRNDFCWATEGEIVLFGSECDGEKVDGKCGCRRAMAGIDSRKATTTMKVEESPFTEKELFDKVRASLKAGGWISDESTMDDEFLMAMWRDMTALWQSLRRWEVGTIIEKRGNNIQTRHLS